MTPMSEIQLYVDIDAPEYCYCNTPSKLGESYPSGVSTLRQSTSEGYVWSAAAMTLSRLHTKDNASVSCERNKTQIPVSSGRLPPQSTPQFCDCLCYLSPPLSLWVAEGIFTIHRVMTQITIFHKTSYFFST